MTYDEQLALKTDVAIPLITETGSAVILTKPAEATGTYVPGEGFTTSDDPVLSYGYAVETDADLTTLSGTVIQQLVKTIMCVSIDEPDPNLDTITFKEKTYKILHFDDLAPGEVSFLYTLYLGI